MEQIIENKTELKELKLEIQQIEKQIKELQDCIFNIYSLLRKLNNIVVI
jgi:hypothetical protein